MNKITNFDSFNLAMEIQKRMGRKASLPPYISQDNKRDSYIAAGRRSGKSLYTLLSIANKYLPKEQYQKLIEYIEAELKPMGERQKITVMEVEDLDNWKSANEVFGGK